MAGPGLSSQAAQARAAVDELLATAVASVGGHGRARRAARSNACSTASSKAAHGLAWLKVYVVALEEMRLGARPRMAAALASVRS